MYCENVHYIPVIYVLKWYEVMKLLKLFLIRYLLNLEPDF